MAKGKDQPKNAKSAEGKRVTRRKKAVPSPETVVERAPLVSPKGRVYQVLRTRQMDAYDRPDPPTG
jgi:hypothetical protein